MQRSRRNSVFRHQVTSAVSGFSAKSLSVCNRAGEDLKDLAAFVPRERCDACDWMVNHYRVKNGFCLSLLKEMGGEITSVHGPFPYLAYNEVDKAKAEDKVRFLADATEQIIILFNTLTSHVDEVQWDSRAVDDFLNILSTRQLEEIKKCTAAYDKRSGRSSSERKLRRHFKKLKKDLKKSNYSADSLEQIRSVVKHHLIRMDIIAANVIKRPN